MPRAFLITNKRYNINGALLTSKEDVENCPEINQYPAHTNLNVKPKSEISLVRPVERETITGIPVDIDLAHLSPSKASSSLLPVYHYNRISVLTHTAKANNTTNILQSVHLPYTSASSYTLDDNVTCVNLSKYRYTSLINTFDVKHERDILEEDEMQDEAEDLSVHNRCLNNKTILYSNNNHSSNSNSGSNNNSIKSEFQNDNKNYNNNKIDNSDNNSSRSIIFHTIVDNKNNDNNNSITTNNVMEIHVNDQDNGKIETGHQKIVPLYQCIPQSPVTSLTSENQTEYMDSPDSMDSYANNLTENHICNDCGKRYSTSSNLARHRQTHRSVTDKKARKCPHCDKVYVSMPAYSMHVRTHSQGCQCPYCGKCFSRPWLLQGHIRTHTGEKPFKCPICSKAFADKSNLRAHIQTHSTSKPYSCQRCGKAFALKSYLYKHEESSCMRLSKQNLTTGQSMQRSIGLKRN